MDNWISVDTELPEVEGYYDVMFDTGFTDEKPFRIRPHKNIHGFMTEENVTHWREHVHTQTEVDSWDSIN